MIRVGGGDEVGGDEEKEFAEELEVVIKVH